MKRIKQAFFILLTVSVILFSGIQPLQAKERFEFTNYTIELDVKENGEIHVIETFETKFNDYLHGIYVNVPTRYSMTWENGVRKHYNFPISNIHVLSNHNYDIETNLDGIQIRLGDADYYAREYETYQISYVIHTKDLDLDGRQMLFYNLVSGNWDTTFNTVNFTIRFPKEIDESSIRFDSPIGITEQSNSILSYTVRGNTLSGSYHQVLDPKEAITILVPLPDDYFVFPDFSIANWISFGVGALLTLMIGFLYLSKGKDEPIIPVVEFSAPDNMTSAEVGYIIDGTCDHPDVISLIIWWAKEGYLEIEDDEEKDELTLHKLKDLPENAKRFEKTMFNKLFQNRDSVTTNQLEGKFYETLQITAKQVEQSFRSKGRQIYQSEYLQKFLCLIVGMPLAFITALRLYLETYQLALAFIDVIVILIVMAVSAFLAVTLVNRWYSLKTGSKVGYLITIFIGPLLLFGISYLIFRHYLPFYLYLGSFICSLFMIGFAAFMRRRSVYGNEMLGRVIGLREFILTAEKDRLDALVKENPMIFYDVLPFAYAFGISDIWNEHFKDLTIPECTWYYGPSDITLYHSMHRLHHSMNHLQTAASYIPAPSGSSGGFSGGSGGGFSGGGFGGSGGGGW
ncbi:MAG: DUF2207 domain-containing protein [Erysipelotrichaceae bacterium]|nr:DUF2207 domain-containing protein [Erysipelotrichaceae bacterium]